MMLASTLSRPRCAIPMTASLTPCPMERSSRASSSTIADSPPSSEYRFCPTYLVCRNASKASAAPNRVPELFGDVRWG